MNSCLGFEYIYVFFHKFYKEGLRNDGMKILKRGVLPLFLVLMICAVSVYFYVENNAVAVLSGVSNRKTVIIDAGHGGLTNTIKA